MLPQNVSDLSPLILAILLIVLAVLIADFVLLLRWIGYQRRLSRAIAQYGSATTEPQPVALGENLSYPQSETPEQETAPTQETTLAEAAPAIPYIAPPFAKTWSLVHPFLAFQFVFVAANLLALVVAIFLMPLVPGGLQALAVASSPASKWLMAVTMIVELFVQNWLFVGVTSHMLKRYGTSLQRIGLNRISPKMVAFGLGAGLLLFLFAAGAENLLSALLARLISTKNLETLKNLGSSVNAAVMFTEMPGSGMKALFAIAGAIAAPIGEEVFFRGFLYNALRIRLNVKLAIILSGLAFALIHASPLAVIVIFPMGMLLAYIYERTRSLWVTIIIHAVNNGLSFLILSLYPHLGR